MNRILIVDDVREIDHFPPRLAMASIVRDAECAMALFFEIEWDEVWLDHDLGLESEDGTYIVNEIDKYMHVLKNEWPFDLDKPIVRVKKFYLHSSNPVGAQRMYDVLSKYFEVERVTL